MKCRSEWQRPATEVRIRTSRGPGFGRLTSSMTRGLLTSWRTAAFIEHSLSLFLLWTWVQPTPPRPVRQPRSYQLRGRRAAAWRSSAARHFPSAGTDRSATPGDRAPAATTTAFAHRRAWREYDVPPRRAPPRWRHDRAGWWRGAHRLRFRIWPRPRAQNRLRDR